MNRIYPLLILLFSLKLSVAQVWCTPGSEWHFYHNNIWSGPGHIRMSFLGNTTLDSVWCQFILCERKAALSNSTYTMLTRVENDVVYLKDWGSGKPWDTLYDFNAEPGDFWRMYNTEYVQCAKSRVTVLDTGSRVIQNQRLRWLLLKYNGYPGNYTDTAFERFGALTVFPYNWNNLCMTSTDSWSGGPLRCFSDHQINEYRNNHTLACDYGPKVAIGESVQVKSHVPLQNPFSDRLAVDAGDLILRFEIVDLTGQRILEFNGITRQKQLDCSGLSAGIYLVRWLGSGHQGFKTVIKL